jgi:uncharacterized protein
MVAMLDESDQLELLKLARTTLESYLSSGDVPPYRTDSPSLRRHTGAFVSLHCRGELRGCIGQLVPDQELFRVIQSCAISAATEDTRFLPLTQGELDEAEIEISVLTPFRRIKDIAEIEVGRHGLLLVQGAHRGLLLPQVATQYNWNRETFLMQTCRKAGLPGSAWKDPTVAINVFEAQVFSE